MSKKRYGDRRLESMTREQLLAYAKQLTRDHGRAQESINRLRIKLVEWEQGAPARNLHHPAPHHRRMVLREAHRE